MGLKMLNGLRKNFVSGTKQLEIPKICVGGVYGYFGTDLGLRWKTWAKLNNIIIGAAAIQYSIFYLNSKQVKQVLTLSTNEILLLCEAK